MGNRGGLKQHRIYLKQHQWQGKPLNTLPERWGLMSKCTQGAISDAHFVFSVQPSNVQTTMTTLGVTCLNPESTMARHGAGAM